MIDQKSILFNLPNSLTLLRFFLAIVFFVFLSYKCYAISFVSVIIATLTDWLDGYLARKKGLLTDFGRLADPFVDKIIICGGFILLIKHISDILPAWMVVVIVAREFLVSSIRSYSEARGIDFGATAWGKAKMFAQSFTIALILLFSAYFQHLGTVKYIIVAMLWITLIVTVFSGIKYMVKASPTLLEG